jgi:hypothetical protein
MYLQGRIMPSTLALTSAAKPTLLQQLHDTRAGLATDPRDKVYALTGILSPEDSALITPDYGLSVAQVYEEIATRIITHQSSLRILSAVGPIDGEICSSFTGRCGSWVPNWSKIIYGITGLSNHRLEPYDAGGNVCLTRIELGEESDFRGVEFYGIKLDVIDRIGNVCSLGRYDGAIAEVLNQ